MAELDGKMNAATFVSKLKDVGIYAVAFDTYLVRFVTHLDITDQHLDVLKSKLRF
ncbi:hypothetical protein [Sphingobacterium paludis]|uniref:Uncharacterized protein n=1 Tax=Sphingobacterium paludis TaxID=1476465 RepID=A0A4R7CT26_9SPHI|nr:hypothetical protein [Sphingobacterium paludis]TDS09746.1 hypothetical protein B0I21_11023 [Sphingobacterium paludis]